mmetsp:Transcript_18037/g.56493  ORF Transcript_18037/g.56493 Transcript_18037/m.56493 type:complete len:265 (-) Transcript_18037:200-994(-)
MVRWSQDEDARLLQAVTVHGPRLWDKIAAHVATRDARQCRDRWAHHLRPGVVKKPWTREEDAKLDLFISSLGHRWSDISANMPGRSCNDVKNRFHGRARRKQPSTLNSESPCPGFAEGCDDPPVSNVNGFDVHTNTTASVIGSSTYQQLANEDGTSLADILESCAPLQSATMAQCEHQHLPMSTDDMGDYVPGQYPHSSHVHALAIHAFDTRTRSRRHPLLAQVSCDGNVLVVPGLPPIPMDSTHLAAAVIALAGRTVPVGDPR